MLVFVISLNFVFVVELINFFFALTNDRVLVGIVFHCLKGRRVSVEVASFCHVS